ncbi:2-amino-4-hydroxy-6-hydroxymethyldihydropteridine diphosphokinase [Pedobacter arcticus]|uniref:2-amino-4-hydroxy-6- hydroxymethyldihydropteridine diphosphokinase n=1 Tax=Pedobacter arcticus TaxID=752140 RepID=UPI0002FEB1E7|nr:2-amino-4-hydroxy-6-hydroxymethyldihydropteridine diphosphokinase [Pedobacter arcticus]
MNTIFLGLGSNLGDRLKNLKKAIEEIELLVGNIALKSAVYETKAWGKNEQPDFLNMVIEVKSRFSAEDVLNKTQKIETDLGRIRKERWGSRTMDIDMLFYNNEIIVTNRLNIPHILIEKRKFVLLPLAEIAATFSHPVLKKTIDQLLFESTDNLDVIKLDAVLQ